MGSRGPTAPDLSYDLDELSPGEPITFGAPDLIRDNQEWIIDRSAMVYGDVWYPVEVDSGSLTKVTEFFCRTPDRCDGPAGGLGEEEVISYVLAWSEDGSTQFYVEVSRQTSVTLDSATITANLTSKIWRPLAGDLVVYNSNAATEVRVRANRTSGTGKIWIGGVFIYV